MLAYSRSFRAFLASNKQSSSRALSLSRVLSDKKDPTVPPSPSSFPGPILRENELENKFLDQLANDFEFILPTAMNHHLEDGKELSFSSLDISAEDAKQLTKAMFLTRIAHNVSRRAALKGQVHYTIGPGGQESAAALAYSVRPSDPALLHYRDTAFQLMRAMKAGQSEEEILTNIMRSYTVSSLDLTTGGRHKALGDRRLNIIPKTSTISSHIPRAAGLALSFPLARALRLHDIEYPSDSIVVAAAGDASVNHASYHAGVNVLKYSHQAMRVPAPALFVVWDNKIGISVRSPTGWIEQYTKDTGFPVFTANGSNMLDVIYASRKASQSARQGKPTFLHVHVPRLFNHAGSDAGAYQSPQQISDYIARDPLPFTAALLIQQGYETHQSLLEEYRRLHDATERTLALVAKEPKLTTLSQIKQALIPDSLFSASSPSASSPTSSSASSTVSSLFSSLFPSSSSSSSSASSASSASSSDAASAPSSSPLPIVSRPAPGEEQTEKKSTSSTSSPSPPSLILKQHITLSLEECLKENPNAVLLGEDIGDKGGNYGCTDGLKKKFGGVRVRDTLLDETSILGMGLGFSLNGVLPIMEICYLAYLHNAIDQLRGEGATLSYFSNGKYSNGMIVRISGGGLTEFGGHFHNENSLSSLLDIPSLVLAYPSNGNDFTRMFRQCVSLAKQGRVVVLIEPIKCYALRAFGKKNLPWTSPFPAQSDVMAFGEIVTYGKGKNLAIVSYGNGVRLSLEARRMLMEEHGVRDVTVIDRPWIRGAGDEKDEQFSQLLKGYDHVLFADECRFQGCVSHELASALASETTKDKLQTTRIGLVAAADTFLPLGEAAHVDGLYLSEARIVRKALEILA